jgi:hypothetical protein
MRTCDPQDERHIGDEPVANAEDRRARSPTLKIPVVMVVRLEVESSSVPTPANGTSWLATALARY